MILLHESWLYKVHLHGLYISNSLTLGWVENISVNNANLENLKIRTRKKKKNRLKIWHQSKGQAREWVVGPCLCQAGFKVGMFLPASLSPIWNILCLIWMERLFWSDFPWESNVSSMLNFAALCFVLLTPQVTVSGDIPQLFIKLPSQGLGRTNHTPWTDSLVWRQDSTKVRDIGWGWHHQVQEIPTAGALWCPCCSVLPTGQSSVSPCSCWQVVWNQCLLSLWEATCHVGSPNNTCA